MVLASCMFTFGCVLRSFACLLHMLGRGLFGFLRPHRWREGH
jgi:hypothetical protein